MSSYSSMTGNLVSPTGSTTPTYNTHPFPPPPTTTSKPSSASKTSSFHRQPTLVVGHKDNSPQPADIAYFTGNPVYYKHLSMLNSLIREYQYLQTVVVEATQLQAASSPISTPTLYPLNFYHPKSSSHLPINPIEYESPSSSSSTSSSEASLAPYEREKLKLPLWMNRQQFRDLKDIRLPTRSMYEDFIHKLNLLFYARESMHAFTLPTPTTSEQPSTNTPIIPDNIKEAISKVSDEATEFMKTLLQPGRDLNTRKLIQEAVDEYGRAYALGSRKSARAQVWVVPVTTTSTTTLSDESSSSTATTTATTTSQDNIGGEGGQIYINGVPLHNYFSSMHDRVETIKPLTVTRCLPVVNVWALVTGGGQSGQVGAVRVAIARALAMLDPNGVGEYLDKLEMTKIDRRHNERKKTGQPGSRKKIRW